ncbi:MAG TPA: hypothetical protein VGM75_11965 [Pseudonocardiaceae bacterium]|jgi:hypothetical protein
MTTVDTEVVDPQTEEVPSFAPAKPVAEPASYDPDRATEPDRDLIVG